MGYLGDFPTGSTVYVYFNTFSSVGASVTITGLAVTDIEIYKNGSTTQRASDAGYTLLDTDGIDFDGLTGIHGFSIDLSDNTDAGFYAAGNEYTVVVSAVTVDSQTVSFVAAEFSIERSGGALALLKNGTYGLSAIESLVDDIGVAGAGLTAIPWNAAWDAEVESEVDDALGSGTGTSLTAIPWNAAWDAEVESEVDDALGSGTGTALTAIPWNASWDAEVQSEVTDGLNAYDPPTKAELDTAFTEIKGATWDSGTDTLEHIRNKETDIETDTQDLQTQVGTDGAGLTNLPWNASWDAEVQSEAADALNAYDPPTNTEMEARTLVAASYFDPAADTVATVTTLTNLPAVTTDWLTAAGVKADAVTKIQTGLALEATLTAIKGAGWSTETLAAIDVLIDAIKAKTDNLPADPADQSAVEAAITAGVANVSVDEIQATALADLFNTDSSTDYASAVAGSVVKEIADNAGSASLTVSDIADGVWDEALSGHTTAGTAGKALGDAGAGASAADIADAVWDEASTGHTDAGKAGQQLWTDVDAILTDTGTDIPASIAALNNLSAAQVWQHVIETLTAEQIMRVTLAVLSGKASGGGSTPILFRDKADTKNRVSMTVDGSGNRSAVTIDAT